MKTKFFILLFLFGNLSFLHPIGKKQKNNIFDSYRGSKKFVMQKSEIARSSTFFVNPLQSNGLIVMNLLQIILFLGMIGKWLEHFFP